MSGSSTRTRRPQTNSRVVAAARAVREHGSATEAVRAADPARLSGLAAQQAALRAVDAWQNRHTLAPLTAGATVAAAGSVWPAQTAGALMVAGAGQAVAARLDKGAWTRAERTAAAAWAVGAAGWSGAHLLPLGGSWWQWGLGLLAATGGQAVRWWTCGPKAEPEPEEPPIYARALGSVIGELVAEGGPMTNAQITGMSMPDEGVVVADIRLGYGLHAHAVPMSSLRQTIEARLCTPENGVEVKPTGVNTLRVTSAWTQTLDTDNVEWKSLVAADGSWDGTLFMGLGDDRQAVHMPLWVVGDDDVSVLHGWLVGANGSGKSTTLTAMLLPGLAAGLEIVLMADGKGTSLKKLEPYIARYARLSGTRFEQVITLAHGIMTSRQARGWTGPSPQDPIITLVIDEATSVGERIDAKTHDMVDEIGRLGRNLGVRNIQATQGPLVECLIGESTWRGNVRWVIGHRAGDDGHSSIAASSTSEEISLLGLPKGRAAVMLDGEVLARRAKIAFATGEDITRYLDGVPPAQLHPADMAAVRPLWDLTASWAQAEALPAGGAPAGAIDLRMHRWDNAAHAAARAADAVPVPDVVSHVTYDHDAQQAADRLFPPLDTEGGFGTDDFTVGGGGLHLVDNGATSDNDDGGDVHSAGQGGAVTAMTARDFILDHLEQAGPCTANDVVKAGRYSRSRVFEALGSLLVDGFVVKNGAVYSLPQPATDTGAGAAQDPDEAAS